MAAVVARVAGVVVEPLGALWAAYSPASGQTHLLNDASAAILEVLADGAAEPAAVAAALAADTATDASAVDAVLANSWGLLVECGLIETRPA